ncbi:putative MFS multidrug transporter [Mycena galericulata]|nr:putative MFS multidrug transporter [Mycena galericulata]
MGVEPAPSPTAPSPPFAGPLREKTPAETVEYPTGLKLVLISVAISLATFLLALDNTIIAVAIPKITDQFHSLDDIGWYGSVYSLTTATFQLSYGRLYSFLPQKWVYLAAVAIFELGSLICGVAPSSNALIVGRAIAGLGGAGLSTGCNIIVCNAVPLQKRSMYLGIIGGVYWAGSVAGPIIGGALTDTVSWRWCFYVNLILGAPIVLIIVFLFDAPGEQLPAQELRLAEHMQRFDPWGTAAFIPSIICLLLALQWGGSKYPWSNARIIVLLVMFAVLIAVFAVIQVRKQEGATLPPRILQRRGVLTASWFAFALSGSFLTLVYLLPIYFQAVQGVSPTQSGINNLPMALGIVFAAVFAGFAINAVGYFTPFMIACSGLTTVGAGLFTTFSVHTPKARWIGYQALYGIGVGLGIQQPLIGVQTALEAQDIPAGVALVLFSQTIGATVFVSVSQNVLRSTLLSGLARAVPSVDRSAVLGAGATGVRALVDPVLLPAVLRVYNSALVSAYYVAVAMAGLTILGALASEWKSVKRKRDTT